jgi:hypothetical protein
MTWSSIVPVATHPRSFNSSRQRNLSYLRRLMIALNMAAASADVQAEIRLAPQSLPTMPVVPSPRTASVARVQDEPAPCARPHPQAQIHTSAHAQSSRRARITVHTDVTASDDHHDLKRLAERTGLEPATPGVIGRVCGLGSSFAENPYFLCIRRNTPSTIFGLAFCAFSAERHRFPGDSRQD